MDALLLETPAALRETVGYGRIALRNKQGAGVTKATSSSVKPSSAAAPSLPMRDKLICFMTGESEEERLIRAQLSTYLKLLMNEAVLIDKARRQQYDGGKKLHLDFERQKVQLQKWGLVQLLPAFQMQAWVRVSRAQLVVEMGGRALVILKAKVKHTEITLQQLAAAKKASSSNSIKGALAVPPLSVSDCVAFCQAPEALVESDGTFRSFGGRLVQLDHVCTSALRYRPNPLYTTSLAFPDFYMPSFVRGVGRFKQCCPRSRQGDSPSVGSDWSPCSTATRR